MRSTVLPDLSAEEIPAFLEALLAPRRVALGKLTLSVGGADLGRGWVVDAKAKPMVREGWSPESDLLVMSNRRTLSDWLLGRFDPEHPAPEHLFLWTGEDETWGLLRQALRSGGNLLKTRARVSKERAARSTKAKKAR